ncbi:MAG: TIGR02281 family clan AA aspartic protease [Pseudomonadota bacterium]
MAPTLAAARAALPPGGDGLAWGGPARRPGDMAPTLAAARAALPPGGAGLAWGGPARRPALAFRAAATFTAFLVTASAALAQAPAGAPTPAMSVALAGMLGNRALLIVNGSPPRSVSAGDTHQGVKVISTNGDQAIVEQGGKRITLRVGEAPVAVGGTTSSGRGTRIVLQAGSGGHFMTPGSVNGKAALFMVDTGATSIAMSSADAERIGINYQIGQPIGITTANGTTRGFRVKLASVRIGDVEVREVDAVVSPQTMPFMLLGNSFLSRFQMVRENDQMVLVKRY